MSPNGVKPLKILTVEDDVIDRKQLERLLSKSALPGFEIQHTEYLRNALELLDKDDFDIVLLDLNLPDSSGLDTLVKVIERHPRIATIVITVLETEGLGLKAVAKGAQDYLVKGEFSIQTLSKSIYYAAERKKAELAVRESEARYKLLFESATEAIFTVRGEQLIDCNPSTLRIFGCSREKIVRQPLLQFSPEMQPDGRESIKRIRAKINLALENKHQFFEWRCKRYDGTLFDTEVSLNLLELPDETLLQATVRDITEYKHAAEALISAYENPEKSNSEQQ
jgi:PAS domain S-box-containing protein